MWHSCFQLWQNVLNRKKCTYMGARWQATLEECTLMCSIPARALIRDRSKRRAELFSLSQSVSAARSQRLLMSLYCCWISKLSKSVGEIVLMLSRLEKNAFNLQFGHRNTDSQCMHSRERSLHNTRSFTTLTLEIFERQSLKIKLQKQMVHFYFPYKTKKKKRLCTSTTHWAHKACQLHSSFICSNVSHMQM